VRQLLTVVCLQMKKARRRVRIHLNLSSIHRAVMCPSVLQAKNQCSKVSSYFSGLEAVRSTLCKSYPNGPFRIDGRCVIVTPTCRIVSQNSLKSNKAWLLFLPACSTSIVPRYGTDVSVTSSSGNRWIEWRDVFQRRTPILAYIYLHSTRGHRRT